MGNSHLIAKVQIYPLQTNKEYGCKQDKVNNNYLVKTGTSGFKITTKPITKLWNIECFHFND